MHDTLQVFREKKIATCPMFDMYKGKTTGRRKEQNINKKWMQANDAMATENVTFLWVREAALQWGWLILGQLFSWWRIKESRVGLQGITWAQCHSWLSMGLYWACSWAGPMVRLATYSTYVPGLGKGSRQYLWENTSLGRIYSSLNSFLGSFRVQTSL